MMESGNCRFVCVCVSVQTNHHEFVRAIACSMCAYVRACVRVCVCV